MDLSISTWNMNHWVKKHMTQEVWNYYTKTADILIFQESYPEYTLLNRDNLVWHEIGDSRPWGSGIYSSKYKVRSIPVKTALHGSVVAVEVEVSKEFRPIVVSIYGIFEKFNKQIYSIPNLHRIFSDLTDLLESKNTRDRIIIGGDFNASLQFDSVQPVKSHKVFFDRLKAWGLHNCYEGFYPDFVQTYRPKNARKPWQTDYMYVSGALSKYIVSSKVIADATVQKMSDHNIVNITLSI